MINFLGWSVVFVAGAFFAAIILYALYLVVYLPLWVSVAYYRVFKATPHDKWSEEYKKSKFKVFKCYRWKNGIRFSGSMLRGDFFTMDFTGLIPRLTIHQPTEIESTQQ